MPNCDNCGEHVSTRFKQVFAKDGQLRVCPSCSTLAQFGENQKERMKEQGGE